MRTTQVGIRKWLNNLGVVFVHVLQTSGPFVQWGCNTPLFFFLFFWGGGPSSFNK